MAYAANYTAGDMDDIGIDVVGNFGAKFVPYISLVLLVIIIGYLMKKTRGIKG